MEAKLEILKLKVEIFKSLFRADKYGNIPYPDDTARKTNKVFNILQTESDE